MRTHVIRCVVIAALMMVTGPMASPSFAGDTVGGHIGFVLPLVTRENGKTTTISDDFVIGFPVGITVRKSSTFAFDLELVPSVQTRIPARAPSPRSASAFTSGSGSDTVNL